MKNERPLERDTRSPEQIKQGADIKHGFMVSLQEDITNAKVQLTFATEGTKEHEERLKDLQALFRIKENYGKY